MDHMTRRSTTPIARDNLSYYAYKNRKITRFIDFHPTYSHERFFFNIILQSICFRCEKELVSNYNAKQSYVYECHIQGLFSNLNIFQEHLLKYAHRNLIEIEKRLQLLENLLEEYPFLDSEYILLETRPSNDHNVLYWQARGIKHKHVKHTFNTYMSNMILT